MKSGKTKNLFTVPDAKAPGTELFEAILTSGGNQDCAASHPLQSGQPGLLVERIISQGETTPEGEWYDQERDEWVAVLEGEARLAFEDGSERTLERGDYIFLPRRFRHRVTYTSSPCIWLAIHGNGLLPAVE
ncbi:cupin domain-containing protein [Desulfovibrio sp. OttesenSCG-928-C06]|nr:cupin domain-containing protein [Desulfovibrio sp. OttesenSCG-928-C06]